MNILNRRFCFREPVIELCNSLVLEVIARTEY